MKKYYIVLLFVVFTQSCQYFEKNVPAKQDLLNQEIKHINWSVVDEFPSTIMCDSVMDKNARKICFFDFLTRKIQEKLTSDSVNIPFTKMDTLNIKVSIDANANMTFKTHDYKFKEQTMEMDSLLAIHLANITPVEPGIKRGIKIKSEFILPIILK